MADPTTFGAFSLATIPTAGVAAVLGVPVDAIMWAVFGAAIMVTRGPRIEWAVWPVICAMGAFAMALGLGALSGTIGAVLIAHFYPSWGLPSELVRVTLAFTAALLAQQIVNRLGAFIERVRIPGDTGTP